MGLWNWLVDKLREPSTYVGLGSFFTAIGWQIAPEIWDKIAVVCMGLGGLLGAVISERKK